MTTGSDHLIHDSTRGCDTIDGGPARYSHLRRRGEAEFDPPQAIAGEKPKMEKHGKNSSVPNSFANNAEFPPLRSSVKDGRFGIKVDSPR